jgi:hypothetical protein
MIIAIDFDGTCVTHDYPDIGRTVPGAIRVLRKLANKHQLILFTMRSSQTLDDAEQWFRDNNIRLWAVNINPEQHTWTKSPKAYAQLYIDDAALGIPLVYGEHLRPYVDWNEAERMLIEMGVI